MLKWSLISFGPPTLLAPYFFIPKKFGPRDIWQMSHMKMLNNNLQAGTKIWGPIFLEDQISRVPNFSGTDFFGTKKRSPNNIRVHFSTSHYFRVKFMCRNNSHTAVILSCYLKFLNRYNRVKHIWNIFIFLLTADILKLFLGALFSSQIEQLRPTLESCWSLTVKRC